MKIQIDIKSALLGIGIGVLAMFTIGAGSSSTSLTGRYQIEAGTTPWGLFTFVIDTQTGEVWGMDTKANWNGNKSEKFWGVKNN